MAQTEYVGFEVDIEQFRKFVNKSLKKVGDLRVPFNRIGQRWYKFNKQKVFLKGHGQWKELTDNPPGQGYLSYKKRIKGGEYIFDLSGAFKKSITRKGGPGSVYIVRKDYFEFGTSVTRGGFSYPLALQEGTKKMTARPWLFLDKARQKQWVDIIQNHVTAVLKARN